MWTVGRFGRLAVLVALVLALAACGHSKKLTTAQAEAAIRAHLKPFVLDSISKPVIHAATVPYPVLVYTATVTVHDASGNYTLPHAAFYFAKDETTGNYTLDPSFSDPKWTFFEMRARHVPPSFPKEQKAHVKSWAIP